MESEMYDADICERVIPTGNVQLMFHYRTPFVVLHPDKNEFQPHSILSGLSNSFSDVSTFGQTGVVFVAFHPEGACCFFNFPLSEIENRSIDMTDIFSREMKEVEEQLCNMNTIVERTRVIEDFLWRRFSPIPDHNHMLLKAGVQLIAQSRGQLTATKLSEHLSVTPRNLERKFSTYLGKSPKQFIKLVRFHATIADITSDKRINLTEYAYRNGYFDQSHFIKEFKALSGYTPKDFVERYPECNVNDNHSHR
jgi:AraC-like DNA-binding protein